MRGPHAGRRRWARVAAVIAALAAAPAALANGGTVRIAQERAGPFLFTVYTEPTPLRTGGIDVSVLLQDPETGRTVLDATVTVHAEPVGHAGTGGTHAATREQATNKLFQSAKFRIEGPGAWRFTVRASTAAGTGAVRFEAEATDPSLLDRPILLAVLILVPLLLVGWLLTRSEEPSGSRRRSAPSAPVSRSGTGPGHRDRRSSK